MSTKGKKLREMITMNQRMNHLNLHIFTVSEKTTDNTEKDNNNKTKRNKKLKKMNNNKHNNSICMALATGKEATESSNNFKYYEGLTNMTCPLVNPTKEQLTKLLNREWSKDMSYTKTNEAGIQQVNLTFPIMINNKIGENEVNLMVLTTFSIFNAPSIKADGSKFQVVDKWGNFVWVTEDEFNNHITPKSTKGNNLKVDPTNWRKAYQGEERLMNYLKARLNIGEAFEYKNNEWVLKADPSVGECRLDNIANYFRGDVSEIQNAMNIIPNSGFKGYVYVDEYDGKYRHAIVKEFVKLSSNKYLDLEKAIQNLNDKKGTNITFHELNEKKMQSSSFESQPTATMPEVNNPFANNEDNKFPWE